MSTGGLGFWSDVLGCSGYYRLCVLVDVSWGRHDKVQRRGQRRRGKH
eukprot:gene19301-21226_t